MTSSTGAPPPRATPPLQHPGAKRSSLGGSSINGTASNSSSVGSSASVRAKQPGTAITSPPTSATTKKTTASGIPSILKQIKDPFHQKETLQVFKNQTVPEKDRQRFEELQNLFKAGLAAHINIASFQYAVMWDIYMVGTSHPDAEPMSVFYSDKKIAKKIKTFFAQRHIQETIRESGTNFPMHYVKQAPRQLSGDENTVSIWAAPFEHEVYATACGLPIAATVGQSTAWATVGGNVLIDNKLFGMTVGHMISRVVPGREKEPQSGGVPSTRAMPDELSSSVSDDSDTSMSEPESSENWKPPIFDLEQAQQIVLLDLSGSENRQDYGDLDWALLHLPPDLHLPNRIDKSRITFGKGPASKELLDIIGFDSEGPLEGTEVILMSGNGYKSAVVKRLSALLLVSPSTQFIKVLILSPSQGFELENGDSGSWVVELGKGQLFGHLTAGLVNGDGLVVPIQSTFRDMKELTGANAIRLPTAEDIRNLSNQVIRDPPNVPIAQSIRNATSRDGSSSIGTWLTSISSQPREDNAAQSKMAPIPEVTPSATPPRKEENITAPRGWVDIPETVPAGAAATEVISDEERASVTGVQYAWSEMTAHEGYTQGENDYSKRKEEYDERIRMFMNDSNNAEARLLNGDHPASNAVSALPELDIEHDLNLASRRDL